MLNPSRSFSRENAKHVQKMWKIERRKSGVCGEVLNRWSRGDGEEGDQFGESAVELEIQRLGRVERERKKAVLYRTLLVGPR